MKSIVIELTNRCNLSCGHCFQGRHGGYGDFSIETLQRVLRGAKEHGFGHISFTGGEPTTHPELKMVLRMVNEGGYSCGFVSNGWNFTEVYKEFVPYGGGPVSVTFSLDSSLEKTHDLLRGNGSYRRVMKAVSLCVMYDIPFTINTLITKNNIKELPEIAELAMKLGSRAIRFGHLIPHPTSVRRGLMLSPVQFRETDALVNQVQKNINLPVIMAPGSYTLDIFPCDPLKMQEMNIDWAGNVTLCCHLSGHGNNTGDGHIIANLADVEFYGAYDKLVDVHKKFRRKKREHFNNDLIPDSHYFPCWYCLNYFDKLGWFQEFPENPWNQEMIKPEYGRM